MKEYMVHKFEDAQFLISKNYEDFLTTQYGDYMKLPPPEERIPQHITRFENKN